MNFKRLEVATTALPLFLALTACGENPKPDPKVRAATTTLLSLEEASDAPNECKPAFESGNEDLDRAMEQLHEQKKVDGINTVSEMFEVIEENVDLLFEVKGEYLAEDAEAAEGIARYFIDNINCYVSTANVTAEQHLKMREAVEFFKMMDIAIILDHINYDQIPLHQEYVDAFNFLIESENLLKDPFFLDTDPTESPIASRYSHRSVFTTDLKYLASLKPENYLLRLKLDEPNLK